MFKKRPQSFYHDDTDESTLTGFEELEAEEEEEEEEVEEEGDDAEEEESESEEESEEEEEKDTPKMYEFGGRQMTADELAEAAKELQRDHTQKSQKLAELEKAAKPAPQKKEYDPEDEKLADQFFEIIKEKHGLLTKEEVEEQKQLEKIDQTFKGLETAYNGKGEKEGLPKFETDKVIEFMQKNNYPPHLAEEAFKKMHEKEFIAFHVKSASSKKGGYKTETPKGTPKKVGSDKPLNSKQDVESFVLEELGRMKAGDEI